MKAKSSLKKSGIYYPAMSWRTIWYSVLIWLLVIFVSGFIILPWFYLVLPVTIFWLTNIYFGKEDRTFRTGLWISLFWFLVVVVLDFLEIIGPYYMNVSLYFADMRNWIKYPFILLMPTVYSLIAENSNLKKLSRKSEVKIILRSSPLVRI